jgi:3-aminobutyryl-CoA ammonia-lyase
MSDSPSDRLNPELTVIHRRYIPAGEAHYGGGLVDGGYVLRLFGEAATELAVRADGDEGLLAGYREVSFLAPVRAGDVIEVRAQLTAVGRRSRTVRFDAAVVCRAAPERGPSAATALDPPLPVASAVGTVVVP